MLPPVLLPSKLDWFLSTIDVIWEKIAALIGVFVSCGFSLPEYVITAYLTYMYFIQYKKLGLGWRNYVENTVLSCLNIHY